MSPPAVPVLVAAAGAEWEIRLVSALDRTDLGVVVVRRCVDLADLLAVAAAGTARVALVSELLRRLDRDALERLAAAGFAVVVVTEGDDSGAQRLGQLEVRHAVPSRADPTRFCAVIREADRVGARGSGGFADPLRAAAPTGPPGDAPAARDAPPSGADDGQVLPGGRLVAVWGPTGAPGRTTVALGVAAHLADRGVETLVVDADVYGGAVAAALGVLDDQPGLAAACRAANAGALDLARLAGLARTVGAALRVLAGIARPARWPEVRPSAVGAVLEQCRRLAAVTVVDCAFCLEQDEELLYDTAAPRRNGATLEVLSRADTVLAVGNADPVGLQRLVRGLGELREVVPSAQPLVVVNRVRRGLARGDPAREMSAAVSRYAGLEPAALLPYDRVACDAALAYGRTLVEAAPSAPITRALARLAGDVGGLTPQPRRGPWRRLRMA